MTLDRPPRHEPMTALQWIAIAVVTIGALALGLACTVAFHHWLHRVFP